MSNRKPPPSLQPGHHIGRPKGARNKLTSSFLADVQAAWERDGKAALEIMFKEKPAEFCKMIAGLMPKEVALDVTALAAMSDEELAERLERIERLEAMMLVAGQQSTGETLN
jgi:hypothetical protein